MRTALGEEFARYYVEFESRVMYGKLRAKAIRAGTYAEDHSDWFEPHQIVSYRDALTLESARAAAQRLAPRSLYGSARIYERVLDEDGTGWDSRHVEDVDAPRS